MSTAAGIAALTSYFPALGPYRVLLCLVALALLMVANLRGVRSSAQLLSLPTYVFMVAVFALVIGGLVRLAHGDLAVLQASQQNLLMAEEHGVPMAQLGAALTPVLLMRAFSSGCAALTGIEAISDSVLAFRPTEWRNARRVLTLARPTSGGAQLGDTIVTDDGGNASYNGLLLVATLDSLFDAGLVSFSPKGALLVSPRLGKRLMAQVGLSPGMRLRRVPQGHKPFLAWHRRRMFKRK